MSKPLYFGDFDPNVFWAIPLISLMATRNTVACVSLSAKPVTVVSLSEMIDGAFTNAVLLASNAVIRASVMPLGVKSVRSRVKYADLLMAVVTKSAKDKEKISLTVVSADIIFNLMVKTAIRFGKTNCYIPLNDTYLVIYFFIFMFE